MSNFVSRGFSGRRRTPDELAERLPPGQYAEPGEDWSWCYVDEVAFVLESDQLGSG